MLGAGATVAPSIPLQIILQGGYPSIPRLGFRPTDIRCLRLALISLNDVELHGISFFEALVSALADAAVMDEDIRFSVTTQKSVSLGIVEPLH